MDKAKPNILCKKLYKSVSIFLILFFLQMFLVPLFSHANDNKGFWNLVETIPKPREEIGNGYSRTGTVSNGNVTLNFSTDDGNNIFKTSAIWNGIKTSYKANEEIKITFHLGIDEYVNGGSWNSVNDHISAQFDESGLASGFATNANRPLCDEAGTTSFYCNGEYGKKIVPQVSGTISSTFAEGNSSYGDRISLYIGTSGGTVEYVFEWQEKEAVAPTNKATPSPTYAKDPNDAGVRFSSLNGQVDILYPGRDEKNGWQSAELGRPIPIGCRIKTMEDSSAILSFSDMSTYVMKAESEIIITSPPERDSKLSIVAGNVWCNIKKMLKDGSMEVETFQAASTIKGTTFVLKVNGDTTTLKVIEGEVEFTSKSTGDSVMVEGGEMIKATNDGLGKIKDFDVKEEMAEWAEYGAKIPSNGLPLWAIVGGFLLIVLIMMSASASRRKKQNSAITFCFNCGTPLASKSSFCPKCGKAKDK